jgi:hypothetical protein
MKRTRLEMVIQDRVDYTGKSRKWVISQLIRSGEYQRILNGEKIPLISK